MKSRCRTSLTGRGTLSRRATVYTVSASKTRCTSAVTSRTENVLCSSVCRRPAEKYMYATKASTRISAISIRIMGFTSPAVF